MAKRTYRYFAGEPLYPFGYGLSFTTFNYGKPRVESGSASGNLAMTVSVDVANSGAMSGDEVVQLYLTHLGVAGAPLRALKGIQRVHLDRGQRKSVSFTLRERDLSIVDEGGKHRIVPGKVEVWIGGGQPVARQGLTQTAGARTQFTFTQEKTLPD
jgi:beta-glucosidase